MQLRPITLIRSFIILASVCPEAHAGAGPKPDPTHVQCATFLADWHGVPRELLYAIVEVESRWHSTAVSGKGAAGLMQLMPGTAAGFGVANRFEAEQNLAGGTAYLGRLMRIFRGDLRLVSAAYFAGEDRVARRGLDYANPEVHAYVRQVLARYARIRLDTLVRSASQ